MRRIVYDGSLEGVVGYSVPESIGVLGSTSMVVVGNERLAPVDAGMEAEVNAVESRESRLAIDVRVPRDPMTSRVRTAPTRGQRVARRHLLTSHHHGPSVVRRSSVVWLDSVSASSHQISPKSTSILAPRILS